MNIRSKMRKMVGRFLGLLVSLLILVGCGKGIHFPKTYPLKVTVSSSEGTPMRKTRVSFIPNEPIGNFTVFGETDETGTCQVKTFAAGRGKKGVPSGSYRVTVVFQGKNSQTAEEATAFDERTKDLPLDQVLLEAAKEKEERVAENEALSAGIPLSIRTLEETPLEFKSPGTGEWTINLADYVE